MSDKIALPWKVIIQIWWAQTWRFYVGVMLLSLLVFLILLVFGGTAKGIQNILDTERGVVKLGILVGCLVVQLWALRQSLMDRYRSFTIRLESRSHSDDFP